MSAAKEAAIAAIERAQFGLVTLEQLRGIAGSDAAVRRRIRRGRHVRVRRGVFANPGVPPSNEQRVLAAVLAAGKTAFASHDTAMQMWSLPLPGPGLLEVTVVYERAPVLSGVRVHRSGLLIDPDVTYLHGIPVSTPERTIVDLSSRYDIRVLGRITDEALRRRITTLNRIAWMAERLPKAPGRSPAKVHEMLARRIPGTEERDSILEDYVFDALRRYGVPLPVPQLEVVVKGKVRYIDLAYERARVALEAKGFDVYRMRHKFDAFTLRGNELKLAGWRVLEFTSAFTDWMIAAHVAEAIGHPVPPKPSDPLSFAEWKALR